MIYQWSPCASGAAYDLMIDWDNDGEFDPGDDVTDNIFDQGVTVSYGRDQERELSPSAVGRAGFVLCNAERIYSPENADGPLYAVLGTARPVSLTVEFQGITYGIFNGRLDDFTVQADRTERSVTFSALDGLALLQNTSLSTAVYQGIRTGDAINIVLDEIGWSAGRDIDPGATTIAFWWSEANAFDEMAKLIRSEGPPSIGYVDGEGVFVFKDRHHRILDEVSLVSQATFSATRTVDCPGGPCAGYGECGYGEGGFGD